MVNSALRRLQMRRTAFFLSTIIASGVASSALATAPVAHPVRRVVDGNGVDVIRGTFNVSVPSISVGTDGDNGLAVGGETIGAAYVSILTSGIVVSGSTYIVTIGAKSDSFTQSGSGFVSTEGNGATLVQSGYAFVYTSSDGTQALLTQNVAPGQPYIDAGFAQLRSVTRPDGNKTTIIYKGLKYCPGGEENDGEIGIYCPVGYRTAVRINGISNNLGHVIKFSYTSNALNDLIVGQTYAEWSNMTVAKAVNANVEACSPLADTCTLTGAWPTLTFGGTATTGRTVTDSLNRVTQYPVVTNGAGATTAIKVRRPGATSDNIVANIDANSRVSSVVNEGVNYSYAYVDVGNQRTTTVTDPNAKFVTYVGDKTTFLLSSYKDELNRTTTYLYDTSGRV